MRANAMSKKELNLLGCGVSEDCMKVTHLFLENPASRPEIEKEANEVISFANKLLIVNYQKKKIKNIVGTWLTFRRFDVILFAIFPGKYPDEIAQRFLAEFSDSYKDFVDDGDAGRLKFSAYNLMSKYSDIAKVKREVAANSKFQTSNTELNRMMDTDNDITMVTETGRAKRAGANRSVDRTVSNEQSNKEARAKVFKAIILVVFGTLLVMMVITLIALV